MLPLYLGMHNEIRQDNTGTLHCGLCIVPLKRQDKIIGLHQGRSYDVFLCPRCAKIYWLKPGSYGPLSPPNRAETADI